MVNKTDLEPGASARKVLQNAAREKGFQAGDGTAAVADEEDEEVGYPSTPTRKGRLSLHLDILRSRVLASDPATPSETFVFNSLKQYRIARALFSNGYSSAGSPRFEDANIKANLRWNQMMSLITSWPVSCIAQAMKGVSVKIVRPARNGVESRSMTLHKPHGKNPRCEREVLENFATAMKLAFGWEKDGFVLAASAAAEDQDISATTADDDEDNDDETAFTDTDNI